MSWARPLYELQEIELALKEKEKTLLQIEREISDDSQLRDVRRELNEEERRLSRLQKEQRSLEWDLDDLKSRISRLEKRLYGGEVTNPKELIRLQQDIEQSKDQYRGKEDKVLEIMEEVERVQILVGEKRRRLKEVEESLAERRGGLSQRREELIRDISVLRQRLEHQIGQLDGARLGLYHQLRRDGVMVAKVEAGRCGNCLLSLSLAELQRARTQPTFCSTCHRLLYVP